MRKLPLTNTTRAKATIFKHACALGCEGIVSKRLPVGVGPIIG